MDEFTNVRPQACPHVSPSMPAHLKARPWSQKHQMPIPWFVEIDGQQEPDFRVIKTERMVQAVQKRLCWICGEKLGTYMAFSIGPMCAINRISGEPPGHRDCAIYSAQVCPFLSNPNRKRRDNDLPEEAEPAAGIPILRNPGVTLIWITKGYRVHSEMSPDKPGSVKLLFDVGQPVELLWYAEGRTATRVEVEASINSGLPLLQEIASIEGPAALAALAAAIDRARVLLPG